jgi:hypothetical protein
VVTPQKDKFEASLQRQLSGLLRTEPANIRNLRVWPGSIEVAFNLVAPTELEAGRQEQVHSSILSIHPFNPFIYHPFIHLFICSGHE